MARVLLINPSYCGSYGGSKMSIVNPFMPTLGLASVAGGTLAAGHAVDILDLSFLPYDHRIVAERIKSFKPDIVGIAATTPFINQVRDISVLVKDISQEIKVVLGGPHGSALPSETIKESLLDAVFVGEADVSFPKYCGASDPIAVPGICLRTNGEPLFTGHMPLISDIDTLPMPAWHLYLSEKYNDVSRIFARRPPVAVVEFSRGCVFRCDFCASKLTMGLGYRKKSPERCVEEIKHLSKLGYREFWLADDIFSSDQKWAGAVCEALIEADTGLIWTDQNGLRVESEDRKLFDLMKKSGCYKVAFGLESGNDKILSSFGKGGKATLEQGAKAIETARNAGLETSGSFMVGLSPDDEDSVNDTIEFARSLPLDLMKFALTVPFPGTAMFNEAAAEGRITSFDWDRYYVYGGEPIYVHDKLPHEKQVELMDTAWRRGILFNPGFW